MDEVCQACGDPVKKVYGMWTHTLAGRADWQGTVAELIDCADGSKLIPPD